MSVRRRGTGHPSTRQHVRQPARPSSGGVTAGRSPRKGDPDDGATSTGTALVLHEGGPRAGHLVRMPRMAAHKHLVYDGPRWVAVYSRSDPIRTWPTPEGAAEVWVCRG